MDIANTSESQFAFIEEATFGTTPATPAFKKVRFKGEDIVYDIQNIQSEEIRRDADVADSIQVGAQVSGGSNFELSYGAETDLLLELALRGTFDSTGLLKTGTGKRSISIEKLLETGATDNYFRYTGCRVNTLGVQIREKQIIQSSLGIMGKGHTTATAAIAGATYTAANTNPVLAAPDVGAITVGGVSSTLYYTDLSFNVNNNLRALTAIGNLDVIGINYGQRVITGQMTAFFEDKDLYEEYIAGNASSLSFPINDGTNTYTVTVPKLKFQTGRVLVSGNNQDIMAQMTWLAQYDSVTGATMTIQK